MSKGTQIGWYHLREDKVFHNNQFETAAWYENIAVKAGKYPVYVYDIRFDESGRMHGHIDSAFVCFDGVIVDDYFGTLFCGVPIGEYDTEKNKGNKASYSQHWYLYDIGDSRFDDANSPFELFPEYEARETYRYYRDYWWGMENYDKGNNYGVYHYVHFIFKKEACA